MFLGPFQASEVLRRCGSAGFLREFRECLDECRAEHPSVHSYGKEMHSLSMLYEEDFLQKVAMVAPETRLFRRICTKDGHVALAKIMPSRSVQEPAEEQEIQSSVVQPAGGQR